MSIMGTLTGKRPTAPSVVRPGTPCSTRQTGVLALEDGAHALLVLGVCVGVDEAHADGVDALVPEPARRRDGGRFVERAQDLAAKIQALGDLAHQVERNDALRLDPEVRVAVP